MSKEEKGFSLGDMGFGKALDEIAQRKANPEIIQVKDKMNLTIPLEDLQTVREINNTIQGFAQKEGESALQSIEAYLKGLNCWHYIFTTGTGDKRNDNKDSIYFVTGSGLSLRLKRSNLEKGKGIERVIQPFMELICFHNENYEIVSFEPKIGLTTMEYLTKDIYDYQQGTKEINADWVSKITLGKRIDTNEIVAVDPDNFKQHNGSPVNHIEKA